MRKGNLIKKIGTPPGTLIYIGERKEEFEITVLDYDADQYNEFAVKNPEEIVTFKESPTVTWINIVGLDRIDSIKKIGEHFSLHPLVLEDILNTQQRPKMEDYGDYIFIVMKMLTYRGKPEYVESEQISLILGDRYVLTFQERKGDVFEPVRERIRKNKGIIRKNGTDYLLYALIDVVVDNYFYILEMLGEEVDNLEDKVLTDPSPDTVQTIHKLKRNLIELRKSIWPLREILSILSREESKILKKTSLYFRDVYDHTIQVIDTVETLRDMVSGLLDVYLSSISNRMNEIMKVLTIIATIFIPLTFIAGIYGMNFKYMPELEWKWGYPLVMGVMLFIGLMMVAYFRRKGWL